MTAGGIWRPPEGADLSDPEEWRHVPDAAIPAERVELRTGAARTERQVPFVKGPLLDLLFAARAAHPRGIEMLLALKSKADASRRDWVTPPRGVLDGFGFDSSTRSRTIAALAERAGLIEVRRRQGRPPLVRLKSSATRHGVAGSQPGRGRPKRYPGSERWSTRSRGRG